MTKKEFIAQIATKTGMSRALVSEVLDAAGQTAIDTMKAGEKLKITGFGTFEPYTRKERMVRSIRTGEQVLMPSLVTISFKASDKVREVLNKE